MSEMDGIIHGTTEEDEYIELSGDINKEASTTFYKNILEEDIPESDDYEYRVEVMEGQEHIKARSFLIVVNRSSYYYTGADNLKFESDYSATFKLTEADTPPTDMSFQVGAANQISSGTVKFRITGLNDGAVHKEGLVERVRKLEDRPDITVENEKGNSTKNPISQDFVTRELYGSDDMTAEEEHRYESTIEITTEKIASSAISQEDIPESGNYEYRIEIIEGQEHIKPRQLTILVNGSSYYIANPYGDNNELKFDSDYSATFKLTEADIPPTTIFVQIGIINQVSAGTAKFRLSNVARVVSDKGIHGDIEGLKSGVEDVKKGLSSTDSNVKEMDSRLKRLESSSGGGGGSSVSGLPSIHICKNIYCVVGDKIQLYYNSFIHHIGSYSLNITCDKGRNYTRYWEYNPVSSDVGTATMTIQLLDIDGYVIDEKQINIVTKEAKNKARQTNILFVGDSLMMSGQQPVEVSRRLKGTAGSATSPSPLALSNFFIKGRKTNADQTVGWEGTGGWTWDSYLSSEGNPGIRFTVSDITDIRPGAIYTIQGFTQKVEISEINTSESTVFGIYFGRGDIYNNPELLPQNGSLTRTGGQGQESISYTDAAVETFQPFWNYDTDQFDILSYVNNYLDGHVEYICILLGTNSIIGMNPYAGNIDAVLKQAKNFIAKIHEQLPDTVICVGTEALNAQNGGTGTSYAASGVSGSYLVPSWNYKFHRLNDAYRTLEDDDEFSSYVKVIDLCAQTDSEYAFQYTEVDVNTRVTADKERRGTDGVHPSNQGYWMMADAWFRALLCL